MEKLKIGVMGCADIAWREMLPALAASDTLELKAVASRSRQKAETFADRFRCTAVEGYENLLVRGDIDAVYMPLPTGLHEKWVCRALESDKHLLVEKSFAPDMTSAEKMLALSREKGLLVMENFAFPLHAQFKWAKRQLETGEIGDIVLLRSTFGFPPLPPDNFRYQKHLGGGALIDAGTYVIKAARLILGEPLNLAAAGLNYEEVSGVDLSGHAALTHPGGRVAHLFFGFNHHYQCLLELLGTKGKMVMERIYTAPPGFKPAAYLEHQDRKTRFLLPADNQYLRIWDHFSGTVAKRGGYEAVRDEIWHQARLLDQVRKAGKR